MEDNIRRVIADIRPQMLEKVIENWTSRLDYIRASRGSPMPEIIFKIFTVATLLLTQRVTSHHHTSPSETMETRKVANASKNVANEFQTAVSRWDVYAKE
ncbi:hypothetical protein TNCV_4853051 [Trichonephila clavipes]|nr:hypothetical protein TNCV_4853051 [Trichonephila clavipes]